MESLKLILIYILSKNRYYIKSGSPEHPDDKLINASLHVKFESPVSASNLPNEFVKLSDGFYMIDKFSYALGNFYLDYINRK